MSNPAIVEGRDELRVRDELIRRATHDLRTPLAALLAWLKVLRGTLASEQSANAVDMTERAAQQLCGLVSSLEDAQQLVAGSLELRRAGVDLVALVSSANEQACALASARKLTVELTPAAAPVLVDGDSERLGRVLERLVADVVALNPVTGHVQIRVEAIARQGRVSIRCQGLVLPAALRQALVVAAEWPVLSGPSGQVALDFAMAARLVALHAGELRASDSAAGTEAKSACPWPE